jgi:hypothetical protein
VKPADYADRAIYLPESEHSEYFNDISPTHIAHVAIVSSGKRDSFGPFTADIFRHRVARGQRNFVISERGARAACPEILGFNFNDDTKLVKVERRGFFRDSIKI